MANESNVGVSSGVAATLGLTNVAAVLKNYTGKNINATAGSRTANTVALAIGDVLVTDVYGPDEGVGMDVANPTTGHLSNTAWVVTQVPLASKLGGHVWCVPLPQCCDGVPARTKANMTAGTTCLILTNDTDGTANLRHLVASTTVNSALTATGIKAIAMQTVDTSTNAAVQNVMPAY